MPKREKQMPNSQPARTKNRRNANLAPGRHMQPPYQYNRDTQHHNITQKVKNSRSEVQIRNIKTFARKLGGPDFLARVAENGWDDEVADIKACIHTYHEDGKEVCDVVVDGAEDADDEEHD